MRLVAALLCMLLGLAFPLLLNGQTFTNSLFGIVFASAAVVLVLGPASERKAPRARLLVGRITVILGVLWIAALIGQLKSAYRYQSDFNRMIERLHAKALRSPDQGADRFTKPSP
jgi:hypothetical protein